MSSNLRSAVIKLAYARPALRRQLLAALREADDGAQTAEDIINEVASVISRRFKGALKKLSSRTMWPDGRIQTNGNFHLEGHGLSKEEYLFRIFVSDSNDGTIYLSVYPSGFHNIMSDNLDTMGATWSDMRDRVTMMVEKWYESELPYVGLEERLRETVSLMTSQAEKFADEVQSAVRARLKDGKIVATMRPTPYGGARVVNRWGSISMRFYLDLSNFSLANANMEKNIKNAVSKVIKRTERGFTVSISDYGLLRSGSAWHIHDGRFTVSFLKEA